MQVWWYTLKKLFFQVVHEETGILRGHLCAHSCAQGLEEVMAIESKAPVDEDEVGIKRI